MKVTLVTGASSGLGRATALLLSQKGYKVYVVARRDDKLNELKQESKEMQFEGEILPIAGDLSDMKFRERLISIILRKEKKIDYLINNAGFGRAIKLEFMKKEEIHKMFEVNVIAYEHLTSLVLKYMKKINIGRLIHIGSVVAFTPLPYFTAYNSTKSAVYSFNRSLRYELNNTGITSTVVLPARMKTGFAEVAFDCYEKDGKKICVDNFNKIAGSPEAVAKQIVKNLDKGKEVIVPTFKAKIWYLSRYFAWIVDFFMKNILAHDQAKHLDEFKLKR